MERDAAAKPEPTHTVDLPLAPAPRRSSLTSRCNRFSSCSRQPGLNPRTPSSDAAPTPTHTTLTPPTSFSALSISLLRASAAASTGLEDAQPIAAALLVRGLCRERWDEGGKRGEEVEVESDGQKSDMYSPKQGDGVESGE